MARPRKTGLEYFPLDTTFNADMETLLDAHGPAALAFMVEFWQQAYRSGTGEADLSNVLRRTTFAKRAHINAELFDVIVHDAAALSLVDGARWDAENVLTSDGVKKRLGGFIASRESSRARAVKARSGSARTTTEERGVTAPKRKRKETTSLKGKEREEPRAAFVSAEAEAAFDDWLAYRRELKKPLKPRSIAELARTWSGREPDFAASVRQSIRNGWQGLFAVEANGSPSSSRAARQKAEDERFFNDPYLDRLEARRS